MTYHHTKSKGNLAVSKIITDLMEKDYDVFLPHITEHSRFDLIASKDNKLFRIQCKYKSDSIVNPSTWWADKNGNHSKKYTKEDFDYFALYLSDIDKIIYPSIDFVGKHIRTTPPSINLPFLWWEDFTTFTDNAVTKNLADLGLPIPESKNKGKVYESKRKVTRPSKEELCKLIWSKPLRDIANDYGVSDKAISLWIKTYKLEKPHKSYWQELKAGKIEPYQPFPKNLISR